MTYTELKINLMQFGAQFSQEARSAMRKNKFGQISIFDYATTSGVVIKLGDHVYANVPVKYSGTPFLVHYVDKHFVLSMHEQLFPISVEIIPVPKYALDSLRLEDGTPVRELVMTHADRIRIVPVSGCSFHCSFCTCNNLRYKEIPIKKLDDAFQLALKDPYIIPRHALISGGTPQETEESYDWLNRVYKHFPTNYPDMDFDVMCSPRSLYVNQSPREGDIDFLRFLHDECGVKTMSINLELYGDKERARFIPEKATLGKDRYEKFLRAAVKLFGPQKIRSALIVGLETEDNTLQGIKMLTECGCIPVLSAFIPAPGTDSATLPAPSVSFLMQLVEQAEQLVKNAGTILGPICKPCTHNCITWEPDEIC